MQQPSRDRYPPLQYILFLFIRRADCAVRYVPSPDGYTVRLLGVSSLNLGRATARPIFLAWRLTARSARVLAAVQHRVAGQHALGGEVAHAMQAIVIGREVGLRCGEQLGEI